MTQVLDHGYVKIVESWGTDKAIIEAARMSTQKGFLGWGPKHRKDCPNESNIYDCNCNEPGDERLLRYLYTHGHMTPFEMAGAIFEIEAPIFVFREWHRHRTQSYNEMSARYAPLPNTNYVPSIERVMMQGGANKQAGTTQGSEALTEIGALEFRRSLCAAYASAEDDYQAGLRQGVPKELARLVLPVGRYSRMRAAANLRNWLGFLTLRMAPEAQWEIRQYAEAVHQCLTPFFPRTLALFNES